MKKSLTLSLVLAPLLFFCSGTSTTEQPTAGSSVSNPNEVVASVGDHRLTAAELESTIRPRLAKVESEIYKIKKDAVNEWVNETLLEAEAKKQGISVDKLLENTTATITITDDELKNFYEKNKARIRQDFDAAKPQLVGRLQAQKRQEAVAALLSSLQKGTSITVALEQPRINVGVDDDPSKGPKNAPITLIEFSDFQCPFCKRTRPTIDQILSTYGDKVHYVFRDFPLSFHKDALLAHQAANCAGEQDKYWEYNAALWDNQQNLKRDNLLLIAKSTTLNEGDFTKCLDSGEQAAEITKDTKDGANAGVTGTPAYFINGRFLSGAQPFEAFKEVIDEELANQK